MFKRTQPSFVVGIPARNEELLVSHALQSVLDSADALLDPGSVRLVIACDSCTDSTAEIARAMALVDPRLEVIEGSWQSAGACRAAALRHALDSVPTGIRTRDIWVATTDADTVVPTDWLANHANCWSEGDHAVAGVVELLEEHAEARTVFGRHYAVGHDSHGHVHGANLGIRADVYVSVGGFPPVELAEDHALWRELRSAGFTCRSSVSLRVATSGRLRGRAAGGFADTLRDLMNEASPA